MLPLPLLPPVLPASSTRLGPCLRDQRMLAPSCVLLTVARYTVRFLLPHRHQDDDGQTTVGDDCGQHSVHAHYPRSRRPCCFRHPPTNQGLHCKATSVQRIIDGLELTKDDFKDLSSSEHHRTPQHLSTHLSNTCRPDHPSLYARFDTPQQPEPTPHPTCTCCRTDS